MKRLSNDMLLKTYELAKNLEKIDQQFLELLEKEIETRGLLLKV